MFGIDSVISIMKYIMELYETNITEYTKVAIFTKRTIAREES